MATRDIEERVRNWLSGEGLEIKEREDPRADFHFLVRYPPTKHGHLFNVLSPKERNLLVISSVTQNEVMQTLRRLWLSKLSVIHEIKFSYGPGVGKPGPVDDWAKGGPQPAPDTAHSTKEVETDETGGFGTGFDPSEWA